MANERIGRVSVDVTPDFDKAELFRQVKAATSKLPPVKLNVTITAQSVNNAIREVNTKKLVALKLPVSISAQEVNRAIRVVNTKRLAAIRVPVNLVIDKRQLRAIGVVQKQIKNTIVSTEKEILKERKTLWQNAARSFAANERTKTFFLKQQERERATLWKNAMRRIKEEDKLRTSFNKRLSTTQKLLNRLEGNKSGISRFAASFVVLRGIFSSIRFSAVLTGISLIAQAASAAVIALTELAAALSFASIGGLTFVASGYVAIAQALGVTKFALEGVSDALGGLNDNIDPKKFLVLTPAAQSFVLALQDLKPTIRGLQQNLQEGLFPGLVDSVEALTPLIVTLAPYLQTTAETLGDLASNAATVAATLGGNLANILSSNNIVIRDLGIAAINLGTAFIYILDSAGPLATSFSEIIKNASIGIRLFIEVRNRSGELANTLFRAGLAFRDVGGLIFNVGRIITNVFKAALPFGLAMVSTLRDLTDQLAFITASTRGQNNMTKFFAAVQPALEEAGKLVVALSVAFFQLAKQPGLVNLIQILRLELLPAITETIDKVSKSFGPVLIETFANLVLLMSTLAQEGGPINTLAKIIGSLAETIDDLLKNNPNLVKFITFLAVLEAIAATISFAVFIASASGLVGILTTVTGSLALFIGGMTGASFAIGTTAGALGAFVAAAAPFIAAIAAIATGFIFAYRASSKFRAACELISDAALAAVPGLELLLVTISNVILKFQDLGPAIETADLSIATQNFAAFADAQRKLGKTPDEILRSYRKLNPEIIKYGKNTKEASKRFGPKIPPVLEQQIAIRDALAESQAAFKGLRDVGVPSLDSLKAATAPAKTAIDRTNDSLAIMRNRLSSLGDTVAQQRDLVDGYREALDQLRNVQLEGTKAFDDQRFAIDQQIKSLQLQQVQLKIGGLTDDAFPITELQKQIDALNLQAQQTDLTESLQLDPLRRKFKDATDPIKELSFTDALSQFTSLTDQHTKATAKLVSLEGAYNKLDATINRVSASVDRIKASSGDISSGLSRAVSAPAVIQKPLEAANKSLTTSNAAIGKNAQKLKTSLVQPVRQAGTDINAILGNLPNTAAPGAGKFIVWMRAIGTTAANNFIGGISDGIRLSLTTGSDFHKLLHEEIPNFIKANKGPVDYDRSILVPAGVAIMDGLTTGLRRGFEPVKGFLQRVGPSMEEFVPDSMFGKRTAEFLIDVAAGKKPDPSKFFADLVPDPVSIGMGAGIVDPRLGFLHKTLSLADTGQMANSLAKTFGGGLQVTSLLRPGAITSSGNPSDHGYGLAADISNGNSPTREMDALAAALKPLFGIIVKQLIWRDKDQNRGFYVPGHMNHVHVAFLPGAGFSLMSGKIGKSSIAKSSPFAALFAAAGQQFNVPPSLLQAVAKAESGFNPLAGSSAGARGLMQLMPATFASLGGGNILNPRDNIFAGAKYLSMQLKTFKNISLALAAYNAGPGNARIALTSFGETIAYVARVLSYLKTFGGFRAMGGAVSPNKWYMTGERGPEPFIPNRPGYVMSNKRMDRMLKALESIDNNTGAIQPSVTNINTASKDPEVIAAMLEIQERRKLKRIRT